MTGFARAQGSRTSHTWTWEIRSVNGKGLEVRVRLPAGFEGLEPGVRKRTADTLGRGNVQAVLDVRRTAAAAPLRLNEEALDQVLRVAESLRARLPDLQPPTLDGVLGLRGVLEFEEEAVLDEEARQALEQAVLQSLDEALASLVAMREAEGSRLAATLKGHLQVIDDLREEAEGLAALQPAALRDRLARQVGDLMRDRPELDAVRLAQEAALLMTKADLREELDRLAAHVAAARDLLGVDEPVGRRFDFLCQEFNRESNTLCAKSSDVELTRVGLALKAAVDQLREQVQNVE